MSLVPQSNSAKSLSVLTGSADRQQQGGKGDIRGTAQAGMQSVSVIVLVVGDSGFLLLDMTTKKKKTLMRVRLPTTGCLFECHCVAEQY